MSLPIVVAGGGIGGLTAALALLRQGRTVRIFEQARAVGDVGAGISLGQTTSRALYSLGLEDGLRAVSDSPLASAAFDYRTGEVLGGAFARRQWSAEDLADVHMLHRADLFTLLQRAIEARDPDALRLDARVVDYLQVGERVEAVLANGEHVAGCALIGADGLRSTIRARMTGPAAPRHTGRVAYRFLVPMEEAAPYMTAGTAGIYVGSRVSLGRYVIRRGTVVNCVAFAHSREIEGESWTQQASREELLALFEGWHEDVRGLAVAAPLDRTARWALYDRDPLDRWTDGCVALLGDAAHPILPFLGMGAALGIEDAVVLARAFAATAGPEEALRLYAAARRDRANAILLESRRQGELFDAGPGKAVDIPDAERESRQSYDPVTALLPQFAGVGRHN